MPERNRLDHRFCHKTTMFLGAQTPYSGMRGGRAFVGFCGYIWWWLVVVLGWSRVGIGDDEGWGMVGYWYW